MEPVLDIENYANSYVGHARINRLVFIAEKTADAQLSLSALKLAADELKKGQNTVKYNDVINRINNRAGPEYQYDREWVEGVEARAQATQYRLEGELAGYKTNLIKESIRMGHHELADFFYERGDLQSAFKSYVRTRDYCTTPKHITGMCLAVIKCAIELGNYNHVATYAAKGEQSPDARDALTAAKLSCAAGLAALDAKKYRAAAKKFSEVSAELGGQYSDVLSAADVALYGGLTALASLERPELKASVLDSVGFRELLELNPEVREVVYDFFASRYAACLAGLNRLAPLLRLDMHLAPHLDALYAAVRSKALIQYTAPFVSVNLSTMATAFGTDLGTLERELAELVGAGRVRARIDSAAKVLIARARDPRTATFARALTVGEDYVRDTRALLLRASLLAADLVQRAPPSQAGRQPRSSPGAERHFHLQERAHMA